MPYKDIITKQKISPIKYARAKELRHEMTPAERKLWARLRDSRLAGFHFRRQQMIEPYIVDFYCHQAALVIEVDGGVHLEQEEYDRQRELDLQSLGLRVLRFSNLDVTRHMDTVLEEILHACKQSPVQ
jgi:very-short-patch-repair endonuclease